MRRLWGWLGTPDAMPVMRWLDVGLMIWAAIFILILILKGSR